MIFGDSVASAVTVEPAEWIAGARRGRWWTVGGLVPNQYPLILRVRAPDPSVEDWWSAYRDLFEIIASIGERHTSSPDRAWFAVWEGHGFDSSATRAALREVPRFDLPNRAYYLLAGPVAAATRLQDPGSLLDWRNPDLFWPDDRRWFVATDVDFWSLYVGGDHDFVTDLARDVPTPTEVVTLDRQLETED
jgi:hypothetical protein